LALGLTREGLLEADGEFTRGRGSHGARHFDVNVFGFGWLFGGLKVYRKRRGSS
jgi:hypothetical protein